MLQKLGDHIRGCYERAAECEEQAKAATDDPGRQKDLRKMAATWEHLAKSYEFVQSLEQFLMDSRKNRK